MSEGKIDVETENKMYREVIRQLATDENGETPKTKKFYQQPIQIIKEGEGETTKEQTKFVFFSDKVVFEETRSTPSQALIAGTFMMLNQPSYQANQPDNQYDFDQFSNFEEQFNGLPVFYGTKWNNKHDLSKPPIGFVMGARRLGQRVYGVVAITNRRIISALEKGRKYLFSIMGFSETFEKVKVRGRIVRKLKNIFVTSLQLLPLGTKIGFNQARMNRLLGFQETVGFFGDEITSIGIS